MAATPERLQVGGGHTVLIKNYYNYGQPKPVELSHIHHKRELALFQTSSLKPRLGNLVCQICWGNFLGLNPKGPHLSLEKEKENVVLCSPMP